MAREEREWNERFIEYMKMIVNHPNYKGLPIKPKKDGSSGWIAFATTKIGKERRPIPDLSLRRKRHP